MMRCLLLLLLMTVVGCKSEVNAPGVNVKVGSDGVKVTAPGVKVDAGPGGAKVDIDKKKE